MEKQNQNSPKKVALVTGAATRIGSAIAQKLAQLDYRTIVHFNGSKAAADDTLAAIKDAGGEAALLQCDLADRAARAGMMDEAKSLFGPISVLINNASIFEPDSALTLDYVLWDKHFALHVEAPNFLAMDFAHQLPNSAKGNIINIIDERVLRTSPAYFSYNLSKATLWTATKTLAQNLAPHIRVNAVGPGPTLPHSRQSQAEFDAEVDKLPLQSSANPHDIADAIGFILSANAMTGQIIALDGGEHLDWRKQNTITPRGADA